MKCILTKTLADGRKSDFMNEWQLDGPNSISSQLGEYKMISIMSIIIQAAMVLYVFKNNVYCFDVKYLSSALTKFWQYP